MKLVDTTELCKLVQESIVLVESNEEEMLDIIEEVEIQVVEGITILNQNLITDELDENVPVLTPLPNSNTTEPV